MIEFELLRDSGIERVAIKVSRVTEIGLQYHIHSEQVIEIVQRMRLYAMSKYRDEAMAIYYKDALLTYV